MIETLALPTLDPVPRAHITVSGFPPGAAFLTLTRQSRSGVSEVREAVLVPAVDPFTIVDYAVPWNEEVTYMADFFTEAGAPLGDAVRDFGWVRVTFFGTVLHQPMNPALCVAVQDLESSAKTVTRRRLGESARAGSGLPLWIGSGGTDLSTQLRFALMTDDDRAAAMGMFGSRDEPLPPILCMRTSLPLQLPQPFIFLVPETSWTSFDHFAGGETTTVAWDVIEAEEPAIGLAASPFSYEDLEEFFPDYEAWEAEHSSYEALEGRTDLAGVA